MKFVSLFLKLRRENSSFKFLLKLRQASSVTKNFLTRSDRRYYSDRGQCAKCYLACKTCSGPRRDQCVTCPGGWQLAAGECHPECPEGFFKSNFGCQKCHHYCRTCKGMRNERTDMRDRSSKYWTSSRVVIPGESLSRFHPFIHTSFTTHLPNFDLQWVMKTSFERLHLYNLRWTKCVC